MIPIFPPPMNMMCEDRNTDGILLVDLSRRISNRVFQENKAPQIFQKGNISYLLIRISIGADQGVRNSSFSEILAFFVFLKHPFWDSPFSFITDEVMHLIYSVTAVCKCSSK